MQVMPGKLISKKISTPKPDGNLLSTKERFVLAQNISLSGPWTYIII